MLWIPIVTTIIVGLFILCDLLYVADAADTVKEVRIGTIFLMICAWIITSTWILYLN